MTRSNGGSDTHGDALTRGRGPDDSTPTTVEEAMDADTDEDGLVDESAYAPTSGPPADR